METTNSYESLRQLSGPQVTAIGELMSGGDHQQAADAAGVHRVTVSKWVNHHPEFQAELNRRRKELLDQRADRIRLMDEIALEHLHKRIEKGDDDAIKTWIKARSLGRIDTSGVGPLDSEGILAEETHRRAKAENRDLFQDQGAMPGRQPRQQVRSALEAELNDFLSEDD